jgi:hypothetical protein
MHGETEECLNPDIVPDEGRFRMRCEVYSRIVGYFRPVYQTWNPGKIQEFSERANFNIKPFEVHDESKK